MSTASGEPAPVYGSSAGMITLHTTGEKATSTKPQSIIHRRAPLELSLFVTQRKSFTTGGMKQANATAIERANCVRNSVAV